MAGLKEIRTRIASVKTTRQVTSAMKMVSAAKLKKAQDAIIQIRPYADKMFQILSSLGAGFYNAEDSIYTKSRDCKRVLIVLISSNRGLCGGFNSSIAKKADELARTTYGKQLDYKSFKLPAGHTMKFGSWQSENRENASYITGSWMSQKKKINYLINWSLIMYR